MTPLRVIFLADTRPGHYHLAQGVIAALARLRPVEVTRVEVQVDGGMRLMTTDAEATTRGLLTRDLSVSGLEVRSAGLEDAWATMRPGVEGHTCCHVERLSNTQWQDAFSQRIDYVFARGFGAASGRLQGSIRLTGTLPFERLDGPLGGIWPSDHAGVAARLLVLP